MHPRILATSIVVSACALAAADVTFNNGFVDTFSDSLVGNLGSSSGTITDDPPASPFSSPGQYSQFAGTSAGPLPFINPINLPGTTAVALSWAHSAVLIWPPVPNPNYLVIDALYKTHAQVEAMDGGVFTAHGSSAFSATFTVTTTTPFILTGLAAFDATDFLGYAQIYPGGAYIYNAANGPISVSGNLFPGTYTFQGQVWANAPDDPITGPNNNDYETSSARFRLIIGTAGSPPCPADLGKQGGLPGPDGLLNNNDFVVFIDYFFTQNPLADFGVQGGAPGSDGLFDNNDFVVFIDQFFNGC